MANGLVRWGAVAWIAGAVLLGGCDEGDAPTKVGLARVLSGAPGMSAAVITSDKIDVYASGVRRIDRLARVEREDLFHVGSLGKSMLTTVIAMEVEAGRLRWESTLAELAPDLTADALPDYRNVTLADLAQHRGGVTPLERLEDLAAVPELSGTLIEQRAQFTRWALQQTPSHGDDGFNYSNGGYVVLAAMLERVTGERFEATLERRLFTPLGIRAYFDWPAAVDRQQPWGHELVDGRLRARDPNAAAERPPAWVNPAGNVSLSSEHLGRFVQLHLRGLRGRPQWLSTPSFQQLHTPNGEYAYGWAVLQASQGSMSLHEGGTDRFYAVMMVVPSRDVAVAIATNADTARIRDRVGRLAIELLSDAAS